MARGNERVARGKCFSGSRVEHSRAALGEPCIVCSEGYDDEVGAGLNSLLVCLFQTDNLVVSHVVVAQDFLHLVGVALCPCCIGPCGSAAGVTATRGRSEIVFEPFVPSARLVALVTAQPRIGVAENGDVSAVVGIERRGK